MPPHPPQGGQYLRPQGGGRLVLLFQGARPHHESWGVRGPARWAWGAWCSHGGTSARELRIGVEGCQQGGGWGRGLPAHFPRIHWGMASARGPFRPGWGETEATRGWGWGWGWGALAPSRGGRTTHSGWQTRRPGSRAGRWWPGTAAPPAGQMGRVAKRRAQRRGGRCLPHNPQEAPGAWTGASLTFSPRSPLGPGSP